VAKLFQLSPAEEGKYVMHIQSLTGVWQFRQAGTEEWLRATVPGGAHTDLLSLGCIPDPFAGDNERCARWVAEADWGYRYQFAVTPELLRQSHIYLVCDGLDTLAAVSLNGRMLGRAANMFRCYRWDVTSLLTAEGNELRIDFESAVRYAARKQAERSLPGGSQAIPGNTYVRKAPCHFGWDWGPQLPPVGIWKDIRLEAFDSARLSNVHLRQFHARIEARLEIENWTEGLSALLIVTAPDGAVQTAISALQSAEESDLALDIVNPQLWWPNGWGDQPLYSVRVQLRQAGKVLDEKTYSIGLRTIELQQRPDEWGRSFTFVVNGRPLFAKGSNWIPADSFPTRLTDAALENLIRSAAQSHQNMLRVWGGGFYEDERFYDLCDRYGILVWQDFIFSCGVYPLDDPDFVDNVHTEVVENIRRLRHRTSLALWCGNNEMEWGWVDWGWDKPERQGLKVAYDTFFHHRLAKWCDTEDPDRPYWPSSPSSDIPFINPNGQQQGDAHYWEVWHGRKPFTAYRSQYPRFMSEFGFQSLPPLETIRSYAGESDWNMTSYVMEQHQKNPSGNALIVGQMLDIFRLPKDFESLVYLSMILQAEGIRYGVEHWRRYTRRVSGTRRVSDTRRVSGTLYWQLNDCWPVASWSSLDYFGRWKALHYVARRFFAPLLLSIEDSPPCQSMFLSSDLLEQWQGSVRWELTTLGGEIVASGEKAVLAAPLSVTAVDTLDFSGYLNDDTRRQLVFVAELWQGDLRLIRQTAFFAPTKHLLLIDPQITTSVNLNKGVLDVELSACSLARLVECSLAGADAIFSDNYFDLPAKKSANVTVTLPDGWDLAKAQAVLRMRSVYDSY
jgi:beta-mannosidase